MFTGIIQAMSKIVSIETDQNNVHYTLESGLSEALKVDQSVAHDGCCLTVTEVMNTQYKVTAIQETLDKTNLNTWVLGQRVNVETSMLMNGKLDGHIVQGHVDAVGQCIEVEDQNGSWKYTIQYETDDITVEKGSIAVNGTSLTVVDSSPHRFSVCIIPYTYEHTNFKQLKAGDPVNLEFDILGKYVAKYMKIYGH